jgi:hypothetical protein
MEAIQAPGETLRRIPFFVGLTLIVLALLIELGAAGCARGAQPGADAIQGRIYMSQAFQDATADMSLAEQAKLRMDIEKSIDDDESPPGFGIPYLALVDGILVFTTVMIALSLFVPERVHAKVQGIVSLIFSFLLLIGAFVLTIIAFVLLLLMVALFFSPPFGTIAYLAAFGFFNTWAAAAILGLLMALKLGYAGCLAVAQQRFLENKGLVLLVLTSLVLTIVVGFLHGLVPLVMVSITDAIAAIIVGIVAIIWAIVVLIGAIIAIIQALATR